jgi:hypothetical protein
MNMRGRTLACLAAAATIAVLAATALAATFEECGDADASGSRTVTDGVLVLRTAAELTGGCAVASRCDVDGSGEISVTDGVAALRLAAGLDAPLACRNVVVDFSGFTTFTFNRRSAFGFCPPLGSVSALVLSDVGGNLAQSGGKVIVEGRPGDPDCDPEIMTVPAVACAKEVALPDRLLTADEATRVRAAFASIIREQQRNPDCARITFDPCLIDEFGWDASPITDFECGEPRLVPEEAAALIAVLDSLR